MFFESLAGKAQSIEEKWCLMIIYVYGSPSFFHQATQGQNDQIFYTKQ